MKAASKLMLAGAVVSTLFAGAALAGDVGTRGIYSRSPEAAQADLVRNWNYNASGTVGVVRQRTVAERNADLMRDWNGPSKAAMAAEEKSALQTRTADEQYNDLVRNWGG